MICNDCIASGNIRFDFGQSGGERNDLPEAKGRAAKLLLSRDRYSILIVEDEGLVAENLRELVQKAGYSVAGVVDCGEDAIQKIFDTSVNLIIMDVRLAGELDGIETVSIIHHSKPIPVVFLTAYVEDLLPRITEIRPALYKYVAKPFNPEELQAAIETLLANS